MDEGIACGSKIWSKGRTRGLFMGSQRDGDPPLHHTAPVGPHDHHPTAEPGLTSVPPYPAPQLYPGPHD